MTITVQPSKVEALKQASQSLRGDLAAGLADGLSSFDEDGYNLLKFHGIYQGYDRDSATELKQSGRAKEYRFMVRARLPGGRVTAAQYLALDAIADRFANGSLRITTRQGIQFHGVVKRHLKETVAAMNAALVTTLAACGDVVRNVTTVPAPLRDAVHTRLEADAKRLSQHLLPTTRAYHEIWLDDKQVAGPEEDALYGTAYLPRKFKIGIAVPWDNSVDVLTNDLAIVALFEGDVLTGYNFALGGGLGMTHNKPNTFPRLATPVAFIAPDDLLEAAAAVVRLHRDHGDRGNRKHARLKYVIAEKGEAWAKAQLEADLGKTLEDPRPMADFAVVDHLGWHEQGDGLLYLGIPVSSGRIVDRPGETLRSALREIVARYGTDPILLPSQDILLSNIVPGDRLAIQATLRRHGVALAGDVSPVRRWSLACPALPSCGLALTEAERIQVPLIEAIEERLARHGLSDEGFSIRITGCPNGCARPYSGDIGLVGRMPGFFALYVGGDFAGTRLNFALLDKLPEAKVADTLELLFATFAQERLTGEGFGDFCYRIGRDALLSVLGAASRKAS
jgi:sulfite reductase (ferredoxin)